MRKSLETWIYEALTDTDKDNPISALSLIHMVGRENGLIKGDEIHTIKFGSKQYEAKRVAELFQGKASAYAQDMPTAQTFKLFAFYGSDHPQASHQFLVYPQSEMSGLYTEPPSSSGQIQQGMRHLEIQFAANVRLMQLSQDYHYRTMQLIMQENNELRRENRDANTIVNEVMREKATEDHTRKMEQAQYQRTSVERAKLLGFLPALANTITGKEIVPNSVADTSLIETIAESLDEKQAMAILSTLPPHVAGLLYNRFEQIMKAKNEEAASRAAMVPHPDPEGDAAGD